VITQFIRSAILAAAFLLTPICQVKAQVVPTIEDYGKLPAFEEAAISPSGNRVGIVSTIKDVRTLMIFEGERLLRRLALGDVKVRDIEWATDELLMLDYSQTEKLYGFTAEKAEFYRTFFISMSSETPVLLFGKQRQIAKATFGWYGIREIGGKTYGFFGGVPLEEYGGGEYAFEGGSPALFKVNLTDMKATQVANRASDTESRSWRVDADGNVAATLVRKDSDGSWRILNVDSKEIISGKNPLGGIWLVAFGNSGTTIIYGQEDETSGVTRHFEVPLRGGTAAEVFADVDIDNYYVDPRSGILLGYVISGETPKPRFFDPLLDKKFAKIAKAFPKVNRHVADWSRNFGKVVLTTNGNEDSGTWWTVDLEKLAAHPLGLERPAIDAPAVGPISTVAYKAGDGLEMDGILTLPPGREAKNLPLIVLPHGGPTSHDTASFDWWAQAFASQGYAVFQPNFRGSTNRDASFVRAGHGEWGRKMQTDISDGLAHLATQGIVDSKRACIVGASYGGYAALAGVTLQKGLYRCAVSVAGVSDLSMMVSTDIVESGSDPTLKRNLKAEIGSGRELKDVSPRRFAAQADAPILLIHGKDDTVVPYKQSTVMADALKDAAKPYDFLTLAGEDHWLSKSDTRLKMLQATIGFVEKHNPAN
jgi:dipeptidyl aminopeptidase/acylaminoacyl peptidase